MIILIILRNASASGLIPAPKAGKKWPMAMPIARPMKICVVSDGQRDEVGAGATTSVGSFIQASRARQGQRA